MTFIHLGVPHMGICLNTNDAHTAAQHEDAKNAECDEQVAATGCMSDFIDASC